MGCGVCREIARAGCGIALSLLEHVGMIVTVDSGVTGVFGVSAVVA